LENDLSGDGTLHIHKTHLLPLLLALTALCVLGPAADAQLTDTSQTGAVAGIAKTYAQQIGAGHGDIMTPDSSVFIIKRDPFRSIRRGRQIFQRKFTVAQGFGPRTGDGIGMVAGDLSIGAGLADSCAACHGRPRGSAGHGGDVFTRPDSRDAPHLFGLGIIEMLGDEITQDLRAIRDAALAQAAMFNQPVTEPLVAKSISYGQITAFPNGTLDTSGVVGVDTDLRVRPLFHQGGTISMREFLVGAFNAEMGLESGDPLLHAAAAGGSVTTPSGLVLDGSTDTIEVPPALNDMDDPDGDGVVDEIPTAIVDHVEFYLLNYFKPGRYQETAATRAGLRNFSEFGCTECHIQNLTIDSDRRVADVETVYDPVNGIFNNLFSTATGLFTETNDGMGFPTLKLPAGNSFVVRNIFADFKRHDLGPNFHERNHDGSLQTEFMTEPLWGVGTTAPYGHDGRSINLREVILRHGGEALASRNAFAGASEKKRILVEIFLQSLIIFPPDDTASNLNPGDPMAAGFPQNGHGSIALGALFNNPGDPE
jgi:hypothetical protein